MKFKDLQTADQNDESVEQMDALPENQDDATVAPSEAEGNIVDVVVFSSHPIHRFNMGDYNFEDAMLRLTPEQAVEFRALLAAQPIQVQNLVKELDVSAAERLISAKIASTTSTGIQSTQGSTVPGAESGIVQE